MGVSIAIALAGIGIAAFFWLKRREIADDDGARGSPACTGCC